MAITANSHSGSTVANTVLDLTNSAYYGTAVVANRSTQSSPVELWVRTDGTAPTVAGDNCYIVLPATRRTFPNLTARPEPALPYPGSPTVVQVISSSICPFEIEYM